jgi:SAM-dependent methyltransferase
LIDELRSVVTPESGAGDISPSVVKQCCAALYESDAAKLLLGASFHPGGTRLTERLGQILNLTPQTRVLDVASGKGASALFLAARFGCEVVGIDYGGKNIEEAVRNANDMGLSERVSFRQGDAECLPFADGSFDAIVCECAFCTFPDKQAAANEFARVLRKGGRVGLSDLTRNGALTPELDGLRGPVPEPFADIGIGLHRIGDPLQPIHAQRLSGFGTEKPAESSEIIFVTRKPFLGPNFKQIPHHGNKRGVTWKAPKMVRRPEPQNLSF